MKSPRGFGESNRTLERSGHLDERIGLRLIQHRELLGCEGRVGVQIRCPENGSLDQSRHLNIGIRANVKVPTRQKQCFSRGVVAWNVGPAVAPRADLERFRTRAVTDHVVEGVRTVHDLNTQ